MKIGDTLLEGRYRIEGLLGSGSYGDVYRARHTTLQVCRAIKVIERQHLSTVARREIDILKKLRHPAIPLIYDVVVTPQQVCIIEELVEGQSLQSYLFPKHLISHHEAIRYGLQLCDIVAYLHDQGVCHHDIKPDNILVDHGRLRLLDYGSAMAIEDGASGDVTSDATFHMGTRGYAAPEMYHKGLSGTQADLYSIGVVLLVMTTGSKSVETLGAVRPQALQKIIATCLSHAPRERYASVKKLRKALQSIEKDQTVPGILKLHFVGVQAHCGTTHCAMAAADLLAAKHHHPLLVEHNDSGDFHRIIRAATRMELAGGLYYADGLWMLPDYHGAIEPTIPPTMDCFVYDDGVVGDRDSEEMLRGDVICVVSGSSPQELEVLEKFLREDPLQMRQQPERFRLLLNFASARRYKQIVRQIDAIHPIRVPYAPRG